MKYLSFLLVFSFLVGCQQNKEKKAEETTKKENVSNYSYSPSSTKVVWTAYKTPEKVGVEGQFTVFDLQGAQQASKAEEVLKNAHFTLDTQSVKTGDPVRDLNVRTFFFSKMKNQGEIQGHFGEFKDGKVAVTLQMNGVEAVKDFTYTLIGKDLEVVGGIDIVKDFKADEALNSIAKACLELHQGKTWSDVSIKMTTHL